MIAGAQRPMLICKICTDFCDFLNTQRPIVICFQTDGALTFPTGCIGSMRRSRLLNQRWQYSYSVRFISMSPRSNRSNLFVLYSLPRKDPHLTRFVWEISASDGTSWFSVIMPCVWFLHGTAGSSLQSGIAWARAGMKSFGLGFIRATQVTLRWKLNFLPAAIFHVPTSSATTLK